MSRKPVIIPKADVPKSTKWKLVGEHTNVRESLDGKKCLFLFKELPKDLPKSAVQYTEESVLVDLEKPEWTESIEDMFKN